MPVSAIQHRAFSGAHQHNYYKKEGSTELHAQRINADSSAIPDEIHHFGEQIRQVINSQVQLNQLQGGPNNARQNAVSKAMHLLLFLSHIQPAGATTSPIRGSLLPATAGLPPCSASADYISAEADKTCKTKMYPQAGGRDSDGRFTYGKSDHIGKTMMSPEEPENHRSDAEAPEISVLSSADRPESTLLLPLAVAAVPVASTYIQALKSKTMLVGGSTLGTATIIAGGKWLWDKSFSVGTGNADTEQGKKTDSTIAGRAPPAVAEHKQQSLTEPYREVKPEVRDDLPVTPDLLPRNETSTASHSQRFLLELYRYLGIHLKDENEQEDTSRFEGVKSSVDMMWAVYKENKNFRELISEAEQLIAENTEKIISERDSHLTMVTKYYHNYLNKSNNPADIEGLRLRERKVLDSVLKRIDKYYSLENKTIPVSAAWNNAKMHANVIFNIRSQWLDLANRLNYNELAEQSSKTEYQKLDYVKKIVSAYTNGTDTQSYYALLSAITFNLLISGTVDRDNALKADPVQAIKAFSGLWNELSPREKNQTNSELNAYSHLYFEGSDNFTSQEDYMNQFVNYKKNISLKDAEIYSKLIEPASTAEIKNSYILRVAYQPDTGWLAPPRPNEPSYTEIPGRVGFVEYADGIIQVISFLDCELKTFNFPENEAKNNPLFQEIKKINSEGNGIAVGGRGDDKTISWLTKKNLIGPLVYNYFFDKVWGSIVESPVAMRNYPKVALTYDTKNIILLLNGRSFREISTDIIRQGLDAYANAAMEFMWKKSDWQKIAEDIIPLYKEIYRTWTDKDHQLDWTDAIEEIIPLALLIIPYGIKFSKIPIKTTQQLRQVMHHYRMQGFRGAELMRKTSPRIRGILVTAGKYAGKTAGRLAYDLVDPFPVDIISQTNPAKFNGKKIHSDINPGYIDENSSNGKIPGAAQSVINAPSPLSRDLAKRLKSEDHVTGIDTKQLRRRGGYYEDAQGNMYLHAGNSHYVLLKSSLGAGSNRFRIVDRGGRTLLLLRYVDNQFRVESLGERLQVIQHTGLAGRHQDYIAGQVPAAERIAMREGQSVQSAQSLLAKYDFQNDGVFSDVEFADHFFNSGDIPTWAKVFERGHIPVTSTPVKIVSGVTRLPLTEGTALASTRGELKFGARVGSGQFSTVFLDASDDRFVIKPVPVSGNNLRTNSGKAAYLRVGRHEASSFERYYGTGSVELYQADSGELYMRQRRIPGEPLHKITGKVLPHDAVALYTDMEQRLAARGIMHNDLNSGNVLWDADSHSFYPINIDDYTDIYQKQERIISGEGVTDRQRTSDAIKKARDGKTTDDLRMQQLREKNIRIIRDHLFPVPALIKGIKNIMFLEGPWVLNDGQSVLNINSDEILTGKTVVFTVESAGGERKSTFYKCENKQWSTYRWIQDIAERVNDNNLGFALGQKTGNKLEPQASVFQNRIWVPVGRDGKAMYSVTWKITDEHLYQTIPLSDYIIPNNNILFTKGDLEEYIVNTKTVPEWASVFYKGQTIRSSEINRSVIVKSVNPSGRESTLYIGNKIGGGDYGDVFIDAMDDRYVIKEIKRNYANRPKIKISNIRHEADSFKKIYGKNSATVHRSNENDNTFYIRMYKIPGKPVSELKVGDLPSNAPYLYDNLMIKLENNGVKLNDIHHGNVLWDQQTKKFYVIDTKNKNIGGYSSPLREKSERSQVLHQRKETERAQKKQRLREEIEIKSGAKIPRASRPLPALAPGGEGGEYLFNREKNFHSLYEQKGFKSELYRADKQSPEEIKSKGGFSASSDFSAINRMIDVDDAVIVSESLTGVLRYISRQGETYYIYKLNPNNVRGASLNNNIKFNEKGVRDFLEAKGSNDWLYLTNGANTLDEAHVYREDITMDKITFIGKNTDPEFKKKIDQLEPGDWRLYTRRK